VLDLSPDKLLMLAVVALVVLGPNRLPSAARSVGRFFGQMRSMSASLQSEVREALHDPEDAFTSAVAEFRPAAVRRNLRQAVTDTLAPVTPLPTPDSPRPPDGLAPRTTGWDGRPVPDDPTFN
jgi:sec-independent protein translocase protein TatB